MELCRKTTKMRLSADLNTWKRGLTILQFPEMQWEDNPKVLHSIKTGNVLQVATYSYEGWRMKEIKTSFFGMRNWFHFPSFQKWQIMNIAENRPTWSDIFRTV